METAEPAAVAPRDDHERGNAIREALRHTAFRRMFAGQFASGIGTWMQNVTLIELAHEMTHNSTFVGLVTFAQLGPMLFISPFGGVLADRFNRRHILVIGSAIQGLLSVVLAALSWNANPGRVTLLLVVAGIGITTALIGPTNGALLPSLVGRRDLSGAVALNSAAMNGSRVFGPLLAAITARLGSAGWSFAINAATYGFVILAVVVTPFDGRPTSTADGNPWSRLLEGFSEARRDPLVSRILVIISAFSLFSLVFIYQLPSIASENLHISGGAFYRLFAAFGLGAAVAALTVGSFLGGRRVAKAPAPGLLGFAVLLTALALTRNRVAAHVVLAALGFAYFTVVTALSTLLQEYVSDEHRGRVMGLWMLGWAGLVPVGSLLAGPIIDATSATAVLIGGAVVAVLLAPYSRLQPLVDSRA